MSAHSSILAGESHGQRSLSGYNPQGGKESDTTEATYYAHHTLYLPKEKHTLKSIKGAQLSHWYEKLAHVHCLGEGHVRRRHAAGQGKMQEHKVRNLVREYLCK